MGSGSGTLVVWSKCDRLVQGEDGTVHDFSSVRDQLRTWISRTYRYFIDGGLRIELDDQLLEPHDPLFLLDVPRFPEDRKAEVLLEETIPWPVPSTHPALPTSMFVSHSCLRSGGLSGAGVTKLTRIRESAGYMRMRGFQS